MSSNARTAQVAFHFIGENNDGVLTLFLDSNVVSIKSNDVRYKPIVKALKQGKDKTHIQKLLDKPNNIIIAYLKTNKVMCDENGNVLYGGKPLHNVIVKRIQRFIKEGLPHRPLVLFLQNLMANPSERSRTELYEFLEHENLPITNDGCFLGYKVVRSDFTDRYAGKHNNSIGTTVSVPRTVEDENVCSSTYFHVGSLSYVNSFVQPQNGDHIVIVKVDPKDVVNVPHYDNQKLLTCKYKVMCQYTNGLTETCYDATETKQVEPVNVKKYDMPKDWDWICRNNKSHPHVKSKPNDQPRDANGKFMKKSGSKKIR